MKYRGHVYLFAFVVFILAVGLACSALSPSPATPAPQQPVVNTNDSGSTQPQATDVPQQPATASSSSDYVVFTDKNKLYQIEVPGNWKQDHTTGDHYYIDAIKSPDGNAVIETIIYDDGTAFVNGQNGKFALYLLNTFYSKTGKEGDIRVTDDKIEKDGSETLVWLSKEGGYSGISNFEVRNKTTFLMLTVNWGNDFKDQYSAALSHVFDTYAVP